jgi:hypothetical protein
MGRSESLQDLVSWLQAAPPGTTVPALAMAERLALLVEGQNGGSNPRVEVPDPRAGVPTWREKIWTVPVETRLGVREVAEAIGRPRSWVYRRTGGKSPKAQLPHRKLDGELVFVAGELREWLRQHEIPRAGLVPLAGKPALAISSVARARSGRPR